MQGHRDFLGAAVAGATLLVGIVLIGAPAVGADAERDRSAEQPPQAQRGHACVPNCPPITTPNTRITAKPKKVTSKRSARFKFTSSKHGSVFRCKLDNKRRKSCTSPKRYRVSKGKHRFKVQAVDSRGNKDPTPAVYRWKRR